MTSLIAQLPTLAEAAADLAGIGSAINEATAATAGPTTGVVASAADEVSAAAAALFGRYGEQYQALLKQGAALHEKFAAAVASAGQAYAAAEAANAATISGELGQLISPFQSLLGGSGMVSPAITPMVPAPAPPFSPGLQGTIFGLFISGTDQAIPPPNYVSTTIPYVLQGFPGLLAGNSQSLFYPAQFYPLTGVKSLTFNTSIAQGRPDSRHHHQNHTRRQPRRQRRHSGPITERGHLLARNAESGQPRHESNATERNSTWFHLAGRSHESQRRPGVAVRWASPPSIGLDFLRRDPAGHALPDEHLHAAI